VRTPELTYTYAQLKDTAGGTLQIWFRRFAVSTATDALTSELFEVAADKILVLTSASGQVTPNAADDILSFSFATGVEGSGNFTFSQFNTIAALATAGEPQVLTWSGELWLPPAGVLKVGTVKGASANNLNASMSFHGFLIPRGNIQRG